MLLLKSTGCATRTNYCGLQQCGFCCYVPFIAGVNWGMEALALAGGVSLECFFMLLLTYMSEQDSWRRLHEAVMSFWVEKRTMEVVSPAGVGSCWPYSSWGA